MADTVQSVPSSTSKKRTYDGELVTSEASIQLPAKTGDAEPTSSRERSPSPALSTATSSLTEITSISNRNPNLTNSSDTQSKKRKLTFAEKEVERAVRKREKEERTNARIEEKVKKDEEKRVKDEDKRQRAEEREIAKRAKELEKLEREATRKAKDAERAKKKKAKDAEKEDKETEKAKKEAEKLKKERSQMRLGAFFGRPAPASTPPSTPDDFPSQVSSRRSSIASVDMEEPEVKSRVTTVTNPGYTSWILPFFPHDHTDIAPANRFLARRTLHRPEASQLPFDVKIEDAAVLAQPIRTRFVNSRLRLQPVVSVKSVIALMNGTQNASIDLSQEVITEHSMATITRTPYKIISFAQDIRPPYKGTYTRTISPKSSRKLSRLPTYRGLPNTNYDYDSEAEWQEPEPDDVDLDEEDEMSEDEDANDDMEDFLDDENDMKRRMVTSDVEPISSGLCWEGDSTITSTGADMAQYRLNFLHDSTVLPIDPYSTEHWAQSDRLDPSSVYNALLKPTPAPVMQPPRFPLSTVNAPNVSPLRAFVIGSAALDDQTQKENTTPQPKQRRRAPNPNKTLKMIPADVLPAFKEAVEGSDLNKVALTEILKKQFPKCSKDAIKDTLSTIAVRQGLKEADKRWVLLA